MEYFDKTKILIKSKQRLKKIYYCELYSIVYGEIIFLNDNKIFLCIFILGKMTIGTYTPPPGKIITQIFFQFFFYYFILDVYCYK